MIPQNESAATAGESSSHQVVSGGSDSAAIPVTRARLRVKDNFRHNRVVIIGAGVLVVAFLLFVAVAAPRHNTSKKTTTSGTLDYTKPQSEDDPSPSEHSVLPIIDARQPKPALKSENLIDENAVERTASQPIVSSKPARPSPVVQEQTLSSIPPFPNQWQAPPFSQRTSVTQISQEKPEHDDLQKSSFAYVRTAAVGATNTFLPKTSPEVQVVPGLGLPTGK